MIDATNLPALASFFPTPTHPDDIVDQADQLQKVAPHLTGALHAAHHLDKQQMLQDQMQKSASVAPAPLAAPAQVQGQPLPAPQTASAAPTPVGASLGSSTGGAGAGIGPDPDSLPAPTSPASPLDLAPMPSQTEPKPLPLVQPDPNAIGRQQEYNRLTTPDTGFHNKQNVGTSGINQIHNPWARVPLQILDAVGMGIAPAIEQGIPGTQGHHNLLVNRAAKEVEQDQQVMSEQQKRQLEAAQQQEAEAQPALQEARNQAAIYKAQVEAQWHKDMAAIGKEKADAARDDALLKLGINPHTGEVIPLDQLPAKQRSEILLNQARANVANAQAELAEAHAKGLPDEIRIKEQMLQVALTSLGLREQANTRAQLQFNAQWKGDWTGLGQNGEPPPGVPTYNGQTTPLKVAPYTQPTTEMRNQAGQGGIIVDQSKDLTDFINANRDKLGKFSDYWKAFANNSPIADPVVSKFYSKIMSYAALQPKLHAMRSAQLVEAIEKQLGGAPKNVDAVISAIDAIAQTAGVIQKAGTPRVTGGGQGAGGGEQPNVVDLEFDGKGNLVPKKK